MLRPFPIFLFLILGLSSLFYSFTEVSSEKIIGVNNYTNSKDGTSIFYSTAGKGEVALVFVHCWTCDNTFWRKQLNVFTKDYQVVTLDLAGHGKSGKTRKDYTMQSFSNDVIAVVEALKLKQVVLIGHSMAGPVIVEAAEQMPGKVIGLIGVDTFKDLDWHPSSKEIADMLHPITVNFKDSLYHMIAGGKILPKSDSLLMIQIAKHMSAAPPKIALNALTNMFNWQGEKTLGGLQIPKWTINSDYQETNMANAAKYGLKVEVMSGIAHFPMLEDPVTFNKLLAKAVNQIKNKSTAKKI